MRSCNTLLAIILPLLYAFPAIAHPIESSASSGAQLEQDCEPIGTYTTDWFLSTALPDYRGLFTNTALFYTRNLTSRAVSHAAAHGLITIWSVWPCHLYNHANTTDNPMRCIHNDKKKRTTFYENMSRAFAKKANGSVLVMHDKEDYGKPPMDGIWGRIELPTMKGGEGVVSVAKIKDDGSGHSVVWRRKGEKVDGFEEERGELRKRDVDAGACLRAKDYEWFDNVDW